MAHLHSLRVENFGPFAEAELALKPLAVLVGPNDSGKSTLLNALRALTYLAGNATSAAERPPTGRRRQAPPGERLRLRVEANVDRIAVTAEVRAWELRFGQGTEGAFAIGGESFAGAADEQERAMKRGVLAPNTFPWVALMGTFEAQDPSARPLSDRWNTLGRLARNIRLFRFVPSALRKPTAASDSAGGVASLGEDGFGLPTLLANLAAQDSERAFHVLQAFREAVPTLGGFKSVPTTVGPAGRPSQAGFKLEFPLKGSDTALSADEVSDGVLILLAFLALVHHPEPPSVLLVEEPENGVHPSRLREIIKFMRQLSTGELGAPPTQVILTTHAPYLLDELEPDEAFFCHRLSDGTATCTRFADVPGIQDELAHKLLGELWAEHGEEALYERSRAAASPA